MAISPIPTALPYELESFLDSENQESPTFFPNKTLHEAVMYKIQTNNLRIKFSEENVNNLKWVYLMANAQKSRDFRLREKM